MPQHLPISVVIPTFNRGNLIGRAVRSVLATLEPGDEVIVADDGSTDGTKEALAAFGDRVRHLALPHSGAGSTRNAGAAAARRPLIAFLDSDDEWHPDKTLLQRRFMEARDDVLFSFTDFGARRGDGTEVHRCLHQWQDRAWDWNAVLGRPFPYSSVAPLTPGRADFDCRVGDLFPAQMEDNFVPTFTMMVRKDRAGDACRFATDLVVHEDWECFGRLAQRGPAAYLDVETAWQNGHRGSRLTNAKEETKARSRLELMERVWGADPEYLAKHGASYRSVLRAQHLRLARSLLQQGRSREARDSLRAAGGAPLTLLFASLLPGPALRLSLRVRRTARGLRRSKASGPAAQDEP